VSASEGERWGKVVTEITEEVRKLGPAKFRQARKAKAATPAA
jgi:coenzyme F420-reducing hydrogenase delta subunit